VQDSEVEFFMRLYKVFDADGNGKVEFEELVEGLGILAAGSARAKLKLYYDMFSQTSEQLVHAEDGVSPRADDEPIERGQ
jgi:Ca2+-binding EF-hand superfamily protein